MLGAAQSVYGLIELILDHPAFPDGQGRFVNDRFIDQLINILQAVNLLPDFRQFFFFKGSQHRLNRWQHLQGIPKCDQISGICRLISHLTEQSFQIVDGI